MHSGSCGLHEMDTPTTIVALGKVRAEMAATTLFAAQGRARDQARDGQQIAVPAFLRRSRRGRSAGPVEGFDGLEELLPCAEQPGVAPHEVPDSIAVHG